MSPIPTGYVDGAWWPRSHDLEAELPELLPVLADRLGPVERVSYHLGDWGTTARAVKTGGGLVRLSGFRSQTAGTIDVLGPRQRVTLLVVPPETSSPIAHDALVTASRQDNADTVESLLGSLRQPVRNASFERGESDIEGRPGALRRYSNAGARTARRPVRLFPPR